MQPKRAPGRPSGPPRWTALGYVGLTCLGLLLAPARAADPQAEIGRRIYEEGIRPDGSPLRGIRPEGAVLAGEQAACTSCHRRSGLGAIEGTILVPPVAGRLLFAPAPSFGYVVNPRMGNAPSDAWARALTRGAYDVATLGRALSEGLDPNGKALSAPMPRYALDARELAALSAYLRQLSSNPSPGVAADDLHLATVVTPDAPAGHADAVTDVLRAWSNQTQGSGLPWSLEVWKLSGLPESWTQQLQAYYRRQPVFGLLSGAGGAEWEPVHRFCEAERIPCVLPSLDAAPDAGTDFYSLYYSPGVALEAVVLASHLDAAAKAGGPRSRVIQVTSDASGRRAAAGLRSSLSAGDAQVAERQYRLIAPAAALDGLCASDDLVLWLRPAELSQLAADVPAGPAAGRVFLSAMLAPPDTVDLPPSWKARVTYVSLFDDLGYQGEIARLRLKRWLDLVGVRYGRSLRVEADAYAACSLLSTALSQIRTQQLRWREMSLRREHLIETLEAVVTKYSDGTGIVDADSHVAYYGRMSLGPRQRTAVRGGTLLRYASPNSEELEPIGDRIVH